MFAANTYLVYFASCGDCGPLHPNVSQESGLVVIPVSAARRITKRALTSGRVLYTILLYSSQNFNCHSLLLVSDHVTLTQSKSIPRGMQ